MKKLTFAIGDKVKLKSDGKDKTGVVIGTPHDDAHMYMIQIDHAFDDVKAPRLKGDLELIAKVKRQPMFLFGAVRITVKKDEGEWAAVYYKHDKRDHGKTYHAGDGTEGRHDAIKTAVASIQRLKRQAGKAKIEEELKGKTRVIAKKSKLTDDSHVFDVDIIGADGRALRFACNNEGHAESLAELLTALIEKCVDVSFQ